MTDFVVAVAVVVGEEWYWMRGHTNPLCELDLVEEVKMGNRLS